MAQPLVSVILPTRDRARSLGRAIESVLGQTYRPFELVVVDDGSTDDTSAVLERYSSDITSLSQRPTGVYQARNAGAQSARGDLVAFIDSDDSWRPHRLEVQVPLLDRAEVGVVFADAVHVRSDYTPMSRTCFSTTPPKRGLVAGALATGNFIPTVTVLVRKRCLEEIGWFPTSHDLSADYLAWFRIALRHEIDFVDDVVADYTVHEGGVSFDVGSAVQARIELFSAELEHCADPRERQILRQLVFTLGLNMALAVVRRRRSHAFSNWRDVRRVLQTASFPEAIRWSAGFAARRAGRSVRNRALAA